MDPIENLKQQLVLAQRILHRADRDDYPYHVPEQAEDAECLAALVIALDEWMSKGGFSPWIR